MLSSPGRSFILPLLCAAITLPLRSQEAPPAKKASAAKTSGSQKSSPASADNKKTVEAKKMELSSLPSDAVIVICEHANEALELLPKAVVLTPEKYLALLDQIAKLKKEIDKPRSESTTPPTRCVLRGKVEPGCVHLEAEFAGTVERVDTIVALACSQAGATSAQTDGRMAQIRRSETGDLLVRIEKTGEYHVKLDLFVPLMTGEGARRGFELSLPRAVLTQLELDLPSDCTDIRLGGQRLKDVQQPGIELSNNHLRATLGFGPVDKIDLTWRETRPSTEEPVRIAEGRILARLDGTGLTTEADLWLKVEGAPTQVWRLLVPRNAEIKLLPNDKEASIDHRMETAEQKFASLRTIRLNEARSEPLHVQVKVPLVPLSIADATMPIGPFFVLDAVKQTGTVQVLNHVGNLHLDYRGHGDMQLRRLAAEETKGEAPATVASLVYNNIPMPADPLGTTGPKSLSWLDLEAVKAPAQVRLRVTHTLSLRPVSVGNGRKRGSLRRQWEILTTISPATKWSDIEQLKILVPANWQPLDESILVAAAGSPPGARADRPPAHTDANARSVAIPSFILRSAPTQAQRLQGRYQMSYQAGENAALKLPRPQGTIETCEIKIEAPPDAEVMLTNAEQVDLELTRQSRPNEQIWRCRNVPVDGTGIELSWRSYRPELRLQSVTDLTLNRNHGDVNQELRLQLPATPPAFLDLRVPATIDDGLQIRDEQGHDIHPLNMDVPDAKSENSSTGSDRGLRIMVPPGMAGKEWRLLLHFRFSYAGLRKADVSVRGREDSKAESFLVPLVLPKQAIRGEFKVRIWSDQGFVPKSVNPSWEEQAIEEVKGRDLPVLVLQSMRMDAPLRLVAGVQASGLAVLIERAQLRVQLLEGGALNWRGSFQVRQLADPNLDLVLPGPVATLNARFYLNGNRITPEIMDRNGQPTEGGEIARLHLSPDLVRQTASLEVFFHSPPGRSGSNPLRSVLQPPRILKAAPVPICWLVSLPANRVLLAPESGGAAERSWTRRGWLFATSLSPLIPPSIAPLPNGERSLGLGEPLALVSWQDQDAPVVLTHAPQQGWLLVCSLGLLIIGLGLFWSARPRANEGGRVAAWFWPLIALLMLASAIATLFWPTAMSAVAYGCEPGAVVLLAVLPLQWFIHQRYRRQVVFLPSFSRGPAGSSLIRKTPSNRAQSGEPSTVDAPPPVGG